MTEEEPLVQKVSVPGALARLQGESRYTLTLSRALSEWEEFAAEQFVEALSVYDSRHLTYDTDLADEETSFDEVVGYVNNLAVFSAVVQQGAEAEHAKIVEAVRQVGQVRGFELD